MERTLIYWLFANVLIFVFISFITWNISTMMIFFESTGSRTGFFFLETVVFMLCFIIAKSKSNDE